MAGNNDELEVGIFPNQAFIDTNGHRLFGILCTANHPDRVVFLQTHKLLQADCLQVFSIELGTVKLQATGTGNFLGPGPKLHESVTISLRLCPDPPNVSKPRLNEPTSSLVTPETRLG